MDKDAASYAKEYLENILSFFGLNTDVKTSVEDDVINLSIPSTRLNGFLIGQHGDTLRSIQFIVSSALRNQGYEINRSSVDVADYKQHRADRLAEKAQEWIKQVRDTKETKHLSTMNAADRRVIHQVVSEEAGVTSESEGEGRDRHIVLKPSDD